MALTNVCHGCLSFDRKLIPVEDHKILYHQLLLKKSKYNKMKKLLMCWECHQTLNNINRFRMKITRAQKLLSIKSLTFQYTLSYLSKTTKVDDYHIIIYEDEKTNATPLQVQIDDIKNEKPDDDETFDEYDDLLEVKEEKEILNLNTGDLKLEPKDDDIFNVADDDGVKEPDDLLAPVSYVEKEIEIEKSGRKKRGPLSKKYRTIIMDDIPDKRAYYEIEKIDRNTVEKWMQKQRLQTSARRFQCPRCYCGFSRLKFYTRHQHVRHSQKNKYECDICGFRYPTLSLLRRHVSAHFEQYTCKLCGEQYRTRSEVYVHFTHGPHGRQLECTKCGLRFDCRKAREFFDHYNNMHGHKVCDYCGRRCSTKTRLAHHIKVRHMAIKCELCNIKFASMPGLRAHRQRKHVVEASERNYCVECDAQFANSALYNEHVKRSVRHRVKPRIPCPDCDRTYSKRCYMLNHYHLYHLKQSKHVCPVCSKNFLTGHRLRSHVKYIHEKLPKPKNHVCSYCGKGFHTRRILTLHIRTHTGERPHACAHCPAAFAQPTALKTHEKSAHK